LALLYLSAAGFQMERQKTMDTVSDGLAFYRVFSFLKKAEEAWINVFLIWKQYELNMMERLH
jgi:hypothetical protein